MTATYCLDLPTFSLPTTLPFDEGIPWSYRVRICYGNTRMAGLQAATRCREYRETIILGEFGEKTAILSDMVDAFDNKTKKNVGSSKTRLAILPGKSAPQHILFNPFPAQLFPNTPNSPTPLQHSPLSQKVLIFRSLTHDPHIYVPLWMPWSYSENL